MSDKFIVGAPDERAELVRSELLVIKGDVESSFLTFSDLLLEASDESYHFAYGYKSFKDWVENGSGLDLSARQAFYHINIARKIKILGLNRETVKAAGMSRMKEICSLDTATHSKEMIALVGRFGELSLAEIKSAVRDLKVEAGIATNFSYVTIKLESLVKETFDQAIDLARQNYGSVVMEGGEDIGDASISQCMELICASYLQDPNNIGEQN